MTERIYCCADCLKRLKADEWHICKEQIKRNKKYAKRREAFPKESPQLKSLSEVESEREQ